MHVVVPHVCFASFLAAGKKIIGDSVCVCVCVCGACVCDFENNVLNIQITSPCFENIALYVQIKPPLYWPAKNRGLLLVNHFCSCTNPALYFCWLKTTHNYLHYFLLPTPCPLFYLTETCMWLFMNYFLPLFLFASWKLYMAVHESHCAPYFAWQRTVCGCSWITLCPIFCLAENCMWMSMNHIVPPILPGRKLKVSVHEALCAPYFAWLKTEYGCSWSTSFHCLCVAENCTWVFISLFLPLILAG